MFKNCPGICGNFCVFVHLRLNLLTFVIHVFLKIFSPVQRPNTKVACELILTYADIQIETELKIQKSKEEKDECMAKYIWITEQRMSGMTQIKFHILLTTQKLFYVCAQQPITAQCK